MSFFPSSRAAQLRERLRVVAWTRQGALSLARRVQPQRTLPPAQRIAMLLVGSMLIGTGVALFRGAELGLPPYDVFLSAITGLTGFSHGQASWALAAVLFTIAAAFGERPTRYGFLWVVANGFFVDAIHPLVGTPTALGARLLFVAGGIVAIASAIAIVAHTSSTGGAFELLTRAAEARGVRAARFRTALEVSLLAIGISLGGDFGIGTVAFAISIGWSIGFATQFLRDHRTGRQLRLESRRATTTSPTADAWSGRDVAERNALVDAGL